MNRLPPLPLPRARGAGKARFFAAVGLMVALVACLARRFDLVDTGTLVVSVALAVLCALVALLCVGLTIADIWREGRRSSGTLIGTLFLVLLTLAPPLAAIAASAYFPALDDVSTDRTVPPELPPAIAPRAVPGEMLALIDGLRGTHGLTVLLVSHHPDEARQAARLSAYLEAGEILAFEATETLLARTDLPGLTAYLGDS